MTEEDWAAHKLAAAERLRARQVELLEAREYSYGEDRPSLLRRSLNGSAPRSMINRIKDAFGPGQADY